MKGLYVEKVEDYRVIKNEWTILACAGFVLLVWQAPVWPPVSMNLRAEGKNWKAPGLSQAGKRVPRNCYKCSTVLAVQAATFLIHRVHHGIIVLPAFC